MEKSQAGFLILVVVIALTTLTLTAGTSYATIMRLTHGTYTTNNGTVSEVTGYLQMNDHDYGSFACSRIDAFIDGFDPFPVLSEEWMSPGDTFCDLTAGVFSATDSQGYSYDSGGTVYYNEIIRWDSTYITVVKYDRIELEIAVYAPGTSFINGGDDPIGYFDITAAPVPEPGSMLLYGVGLLCLAGTTRKK